MGYRKEIDASTTVEAAFVIPLIVIVIFVFFRLLFFMYARIKIDADLDRAAREASERYVLYGAMTGEGSEGSFLNSYIRDYPYYMAEDIDIKKEHGSIVAAASLKSVNKGEGFAGVLMNNMNMINSTTSVNYWNCPTIKRIINVILGMRGG